jgi:hypothetical protein
MSINVEIIFCVINDPWHVLVVKFEEVLASRNALKFSGLNLNAIQNQFILMTIFFFQTKTIIYVKEMKKFYALLPIYTKQFRT